MKIKSMKIRSVLALSAAVVGVFGGLASNLHAETTKLENVSYDPTRELYRDVGAAFEKEWKAQTQQDVHVDSSHGGSAKQARSVIEGQPADVVSLGISVDIDAIAKKGLINADWETRLPQHASPYTSTVVFLVRHGNPKSIKDWGDLVNEGVEVITPNPKTSSGGRWSYIAAYGWALKTGDKDKARTFIGNLYHHVPVLDAGARGSTITFESGKGDVLLAWENEALLALKEKPGKYDVVYPSTSVLAEPPVAVVDKEVDERGTREIAEGFVKFLYSEKGQDLIGKNFYRPRDEAAAKKYADQFRQIDLWTVEDLLGGWKKVQPEHFSDGGIFDQVQGGSASAVK